MSKMRNPCHQNSTQEVKEKIVDLPNKMPLFGYRHIMALLGFSVLTVMNMERTSTSVAIVAMANRKPGNETLNKSKIQSCFYNESISLDSNTTEEETGDFEWDSTQQGTVLGVGFAGYVVSNILAGRMAETFGAKWTLFFGNLVSTICTLISPAAAYWSIYALMVAHFIRGLAQGFNLPPVFVLMANWFPRSERSRLSAIVMTGFCAGPVISALFSGWLCDIPELGWPSVFYVVGGIHVILCFFLLFIYHEGPLSHPHITPQEREYITQEQDEKMSKKRPPLPWRKVFSSVHVYALFVGVYGYYWACSHFFTMHPAYMKNVLQYSMTENGIYTCLPFVCMVLGSLFSGFTSGKMENYFSIDTTRKVHNSLFSLGFCVSLVGVVLAGCNRMMSTISFYFSGFFAGLGLSGCIVASADMSPSFAGSLSGISTTLASVSTSTVPIIAGEMIKNGLIEEWRNVFYMHIAVVIITGLCFHIFGSAKLQHWNSVDPIKTEKPIATLKLQPQPLEDGHSYSVTHM